MFAASGRIDPVRAGGHPGRRPILEFGRRFVSTMVSCGSAARQLTTSHGA